MLHPRLRSLTAGPAILSTMPTDKNQFQDGEPALLLDRKGRQYLINLAGEQVFHSHLGRLYHDQLIGNTVGDWYRTDRGHTVLAVRPTLADMVRQMPRGRQIIYPKDLGNIVNMADVFPGATVIEGGLGSGSLTSALLRAVGSGGRVITYEIDESVPPLALANVKKAVPDPSNLTVKVEDIYQGIAERDVDRVVLDVPEPWQAVSHRWRRAGDGRHPAELRAHYTTGAPAGAMELERDGRFQRVETVETLLRPWHVTQRSVRPAHRMVAHSGFLTTAVRCVPRRAAAEAQNEPEDDSPEEDGNGSDE